MGLRPANLAPGTATNALIMQPPASLANLKSVKAHSALISVKMVSLKTISTIACHVEAPACFAIRAIFASAARTDFT